MSIHIHAVDEVCNMAMAVDDVCNMAMVDEVHEVCNMVMVATCPTIP